MNVSAKIGLSTEPQADGAEDSKPPAQEPTPPDEPWLPGDSGLGGAVQRIRASAKNLVLLFTGIAGVLVGASAFTAFGKLEDFGSSPRPWVAVWGLVAAGTGLYFVIRESSRIEEPVGMGPQSLRVAEAISSDEADDSDWKLFARLHPDPVDRADVEESARFIRDHGLIAISIPPGVSNPFDHLLTTADGARFAYFERINAGRGIPTNVLPETTERMEKEYAIRMSDARDRVRLTQSELGRLVDIANYIRLSRRWGRAKVVILRAAALAAAGILAFVWAVNGPADEQKDSSDESMAAQARATISVTLADGRTLSVDGLDQASLDRAQQGLGRRLNTLLGSAPVADLIERIASAPVELQQRLQRQLANEVLKTISAAGDLGRQLAVDQLRELLGPGGDSRATVSADVVQSALEAALADPDLRRQLRTLAPDVRGELEAAIRAVVPGPRAGARTPGAMLRQLGARELTLVNAGLRGADLRRIEVDRLVLTDADLDGADLSEATIGS